MKFVQLIISGGADHPVASFDGKTPLERASTPELDGLAKSGRVGAVVTLPRGVPPGPEVSMLSLLGYNPTETRLHLGPLEAHGAGIEVATDDLVLMGSFVSLYNERIADLTAGRVSPDEATVLLADIQKALDDTSVRFELLGGHRFLMIVTEWGDLRVETSFPHAGVRRAVREVYPSGEGGARLGRVLDRARDVLRDHEINQVRIDLGENPANFVWLWGAGKRGTLRSFTRLHNVASAASVAGDRLARGLCARAGLQSVDVAGATGDLDSDLAAKAKGVNDALDTHEFVSVHVQMAAEAGDLPDANAKVNALERIDAELVAPMRHDLQRRDKWRLLVAADPSISAMIEGSTPPPAIVLMAGSDIPDIRGYPFDEAHGALSEFQIDSGKGLMEFFLGPRPRR